MSQYRKGCQGFIVVAAEFCLVRRTRSITHEEREFFWGVGGGGGGGGGGREVRSTCQRMKDKVSVPVSCYEYPYRVPDNIPLARVLVCLGVGGDFLFQTQNIVPRPAAGLYTCARDSARSCGWITSPLCPCKAARSCELDLGTRPPPTSILNGRLKRRCL